MKVLCKSILSPRSLLNLSKVICLLLVIGAGLALSILSLSAQPVHKKKLMLMGTHFEIMVRHANDTLAWEAINAGIAEIRRVESVISSWDPNSETSAVNRAAGKQAVHVSSELFELVRRSLKIAELTGGAFDISFASMDKLYTFDRGEHPLPSAEQIREAASKIGYKNIILNTEASSIFLSKPGMKIGFGGIGQGYAANRAKKVLMDMGIEHGVVNVSGDVVAWGKNEQNQPWTVGITNPFQTHTVLGKLSMEQGAVITSGSYEKFFTYQGKRYAHIIDPRTGYPVQGIVSATVIGQDPEITDALSTSLFVLGMQEGLMLLNALPGYEGIIVSEDGTLHKSNHLKLIN